jgi:uncharacterized membrane protein YeiH
MNTLLSVLDFCGTFVFAISGATAGVRRRLDLFGVLVLSFAAANSGGITRDLLIGATPPVAIEDWRYAAVSLLAGALVFYGYDFVGRLHNPVLIFDAAGLALFAVAGADKALTYGLQPAPAAFLGMLTGIGGGMARDILLAEVPIVLRAELYAVAGLAGATVVVLGDRLHVPFVLSAVVGAVLCFGLRVMAVRRGWHLPIAGEHGHPNTESPAGDSQAQDNSTTCGHNVGLLATSVYLLTGATSEGGWAGTGRRTSPFVITYVAIAAKITTSATHTRQSL